MYPKFFASLFTALSLTTLLTNNSVAAPSISTQKQFKACALKAQTVNSRKFAETNKYSEIDFSKQLRITTTGSKIVAKFSSLNRHKQLVKLDDLANSLGYKTFDWVNYVVNDPYGINDHQGQPLSTPYNDPPNGGYEYGAADNQPFYWDVELCQNCLYRHNAQHPRNQQKFSLTFEDNPTDYRLKKGESVIFVTHLVGRKNRKSPQDNFQWDILSTFSWELTNNSLGVGQVTLLSQDNQILKPSRSMLARIREDGGNIVPSSFC